MSADDIIEKGRQAWDRLKRSRSFDDYLDVGHALMEGRNWAMGEANVNQPVGRAFNDMMGKWLHKHGFDDIGKATRSQIIACIKHQPAIEAWRAGLPPEQRLTLNHPLNVLRRWRGSRPRAKTDKSSPIAELKAKVVRLEAEIKRLKDKRGNSFTPTDTPAHIAEAIVAEMIGATANKLVQTGMAIHKRLQMEASKQRMREDKQKAGPKKGGRP
jgi:hypothetical protein